MVTAVRAQPVAVEVPASASLSNTPLQGGPLSLLPCPLPSHTFCKSRLYYAAFNSCRRRSIPICFVLFRPHTPDLCFECGASPHTYHKERSQHSFKQWHARHGSHKQHAGWCPRQIWHRWCPHTTITAVAAEQRKLRPHRHRTSFYTHPVFVHLISEME